MTVMLTMPPGQPFNWQSLGRESLPSEKLNQQKKLIIWISFILSFEFLSIYHLGFFQFISIVQWRPDSLSTDSLWDANRSPARSWTSRKPVLRERPENWNPDNNSSDNDKGKTDWKIPKSWTYYCWINETM